MSKVSLRWLLVFGVIAVGAVALWRGTMPAPETPPPTDAPAVREESLFRIVAFGDSLTAGYNLPVSEAYPAVLGETLRRQQYSVSVINAGVSGETTAGGVRRTDFIRSLDPDIVLFGLGGNDALRFLDPAETRANLRRALTALLTGDQPPRVILLGMRAPGNADAAYRQAFDAIYPDLAKEFRLPLAPFLLEGVALDPAFTLPDGIHPNAAGYRRIVDRNILPVLLPLLPVRALNVEPQAEIRSPVTVRGEIRGNWFFEGSFPVRILDANGKELAVVPARARGEWMTTDFVPFEATLEFASPATPTGTLVLEKDNPSDLPENAGAVRIPIRFAL